MRQSNSARVVSTVMLAIAFAVVRPVGAAPQPTTATLAQYKPTKTEALARFAEGNRLYKSGTKADRPFADRGRDLKRAIEEYSAGQQLEDAPAFDYNIGHAAMALGDDATAVAHLQRFLDRAHPEPEHQLREAVERELARLDPTGSLRVGLRRAPAEVAPPLATEPVRPIRSPAPAPHPTPTPSVTSIPLATPPPSPTMSQPPPASRTRAWTYLGWSLTVAGVAGGGVTAWLGISSAQADSDSKDADRSSSDRLALQDRADSRRRAAYGVGIGSGVLLVAGVVTLAIPARADKQATTAWNLGLTGNGVAVFGRF